MVHAGSLPIVVAGVSANSSPRCGPWIGTIQPRSCMPPPAPPEGSMTKAWVLAGFALAAAAAAAACAQYGQESQVLSSCWLHWVQIFFLKISPSILMGGFGLTAPAAPAAPLIC